MNDKNNFDTLDILAAAVGLALAFTLLPQRVYYGIEETVVVELILAAVTIKRFCFPTKSANPNSHAGIRMVYLFLALFGAACMGLALFAIFVGYEELRVPGVIELILGAGVVLLALATVIDRRWLKLSE